MRAIILPESWHEEATVSIERLNSDQPLYFTIPFADSSLMKLNEYTSTLVEFMAKNQADSALIVVPKYFASGDKIDLWPAMLQSHCNWSWVSSLFFADSWEEVEAVLMDISAEANIKIPTETHLTCQYQPPYTSILKQWEDRERKTYHPGDYFKEDILPAISQMTGNWIYWGHGEGDKLRGYGQLHTTDLLAHKCKKPLKSTLWFTCSTLDKNYPENLALTWYLSGATKCLLASPEKVNTEENKLLSEAWLAFANTNREKTIAALILEILQEDPLVFETVLNQYFLLGIPWVSCAI